MGLSRKDQRKRQEGHQGTAKGYAVAPVRRQENDTLEGKSVHTGGLKVKQTTCRLRVRLPLTPSNTRSKVNLKKHYEKMHSARLQCVRTAFDGASKRGCPKAGGRAPRRGGRPPALLGESFSRKDLVTQRLLRKWFIDTMMPLSLIDTPPPGILQPPGAGVFGSVQEDPGQGNRTRSPTPPSRTS
ncbi:hypothetical protein GWK47_038727 [Chionoecetes opilio]|uniref:Uncharacterized protein n=1 Tax=Chionoecetes opilio TaxID=41210 RepID=A0A8J4YKW1_CHIOP|nr:hypothetical protein GWK47_038727 [Chionoecetes opilio]